MSHVIMAAELGVNHNGSVDTALAMVRSAAKCGVDAVKVQAFCASEFCTRDAMYQGQRQVDMFRRYELDREALARIAAECKACGVDFFGTPDSLEQGRLLKALGAKWIKVGSDDITNLPLISELAKLGLPMILSTGMATADEICAACDAVEEALDANGWLADKLTLLHCVSLYPTPIERANLSRMNGLLECRFVPVGYSDHTNGIEAAVGAACIGATLIEKHFTMDRDADGPDHAFSADPEQMSELVRRIRLVEVMIGNGGINPSPAELEMRKIARRSIVSAVHLVPGERIKASDLAYKRPGTGLLPSMAQHIIGKTATRALAPDEQFKEGDWA